MNVLSAVKNSKGEKERETITFKSTITKNHACSLLQMQEDFELVIFLINSKCNKDVGLYKNCLRDLIEIYDDASKKNLNLDWARCARVVAQIFPVWCKYSDVCTYFNVLLARIEKYVTSENERNKLRELIKSGVDLPSKTIVLNVYN